MPAFTAPTTLGSTAHPNKLNLAHHRATPRTLVISASGDIDASNAEDLLALVRQAGSCDGLVFDLSAVKFFGTEGLSVLRAFSEGDPATLRTAIVPSLAVTRLLRLCTPAPPFLLARDLDAALIAVQSGRPVLELVTEAGS